METTSAGIEDASAGTAPSPCPACRARTVRFFREVPDHEYGLAHVARYAHCGGCGTIYQTPMPGVAQLSAFYPQHYHSLGGESRIGRFRNDMRLRRLDALVPGEGALLDYGCGSGGFLLRAAERMRGRALYGFEIHDRREVARIGGGAVTIVRGELSHLLELLPPCGIITMNHVIEHLPDPSDVLAALRERLVPGGVLEGQTPAAGSLEHRVFGRNWSGYHAPRHTVVFSPAGLGQLLARAGLVDVSIDRAFNPAGVAVSLASVLQCGAPGVVARRGLSWVLWLGLATLLCPIDLISGAPGIINFQGRRPA